ncbi:unnamed protein product [Phytophthora fragariaefolia]|uniref:Unnamed protein product n=1 Tax=Phytophthora fragariaefolia TaxID=1490495 RepID=A0A9W6WYP4_9STRA|nr:unnamed protein product [Phytophthora fragariaefolia]
MTYWSRCNHFKKALSEEDAATVVDAMVRTDDNDVVLAPSLRDADRQKEEENKDDDNQQTIISLDAQLEDLESRILASSREDCQDDNKYGGPNGSQCDPLSERNIGDREKRKAVRHQQIQHQEDAPWIITEIPSRITTPGYAALEAFQTKRWREILQLVSTVGVLGLTFLRSCNSRLLL